MASLEVSSDMFRSYTLRALVVATLAATSLLVSGGDLPALAQAAQTAGGETLGTTSGTPVVVLPYGEGIAAVQSILSTVLTAAITGLLVYLPFPLRMLIRTYGVRNMVDQALGVAIAATPGATKDAKLEINVASPVLARAIQHAVDTFPSLVKSVGGVEALQAKLIAAMHLESDVTAARLISDTPNTVKNTPLAREPAAPEKLDLRSPL